MKKNELVDILLKDISFRDFLTDIYIMSNLENEEGIKNISSMYVIYKSGVDAKTIVNLMINSKKYL